MFIASFGMVTALYRESLGESMANAEHLETVRGIMTEIHAIAQRKGIDLPADIVEQSINKATNFPFAARTSYQRDIENKSRFNEGDLYGGTIIREGKALRIGTPVTESVYQQITNKY
jgi:2-dehydropantoate 2-reductase